ncbi:MAG: hypothetical protein OHK0039_38800 [Bacteroidia bacterium]
MRLNLPKQTATDEPLLEKQYYFWFAMMLIKSLHICLAPDFVLFDKLLIGIFCVLIIINIQRPVELMYLFIATYFCDTRDWFSRHALVDAGGTRILFLDFFFSLFIVLTILKLLTDRRMNRFYMLGLFVVITIFWMMNFVQGLMSGPVGSVIGEARFYFASVFVIAGASMYRHRPEHALRKFAAIVSLCSINAAFYLVAMIITGTSEEEGRFNPGNSEAEVMFFGLLLIFLDFLYKTKLHVLRSNHGILIAVYIGLVFVTGVRTVILMTAVTSFYFLFLSPRLTILKKVGIVVAALVAGVIAVQLEPVQKVLDTQTEYINIMQGKGNKHNRTTADFRKLMWGVFWEKLTSSPQRMLLGRPFSNEMIDIRSIGWDYKDSGKFVDNSLAHNDFIAISMTNGLVFTSLLLIFYFGYSIQAFRLARRAPDLGPMLIFMGCVLFFQVLQSGTNAEIKHYGFSITLWFHVGLMAAAFNHVSARKKKVPNYEDSQDQHRNALLQPGAVH